MCVDATTLDASSPERFISAMTDTAAEQPLPPTVARVLSTFRALGREEKMQTLLHFAKKLEPLPERLASLDRAEFTVPECQTRVDLFPELRGGKLYFYADLNARQSPTIAAFLAILFSAINGQPPQTTLAIPADFVRQMMEGIGLAGREAGLNAMLARVKRHAQHALDGRRLHPPPQSP
jgi:cysteine desulfuration protein SufE